MKTIEEISKLGKLMNWSIMPNVSKNDAMKQLADKNVNAMLVLEAGRLVGLVSEGNSFSKVILTGKSFNETKLREIITRNSIEISFNQIVEKCQALTQINHVLHLPIMVDGYLIGIISMEDLARIILSED